MDIEFHERLTILTGANGAGKTTVLHLLNRHWGWNLQFVSTPRFSKRGVRSYWSGFWDSAFSSPEEPDTAERTIVGGIEYTTGDQATISVPGNVAEVFAVELRPRRELHGVYVPSHRPLYVFQKVEQIPTAVDAKEQIFETYLNEVRERFAFSHRVQSPSFRIKSALISLATFGYGNEAVERNDDAIRTFEGFEATLRVVLPSSLGFRSIGVKVPDVTLKTDTGEFSFDAVSGGIAALIDITWQIYLYSLIHDSFVVAIDEPEAHLHPALQQRLLPDLLRAFPAAQFVVATHNPLMVASVPESNVFVLNYDSEHRVRSTLLDFVNKAGTANEILRDVLGVPYTLPLWVDEILQETVADFGDEPISEERLAKLRKRMEALGLGHLFPEAFNRVLGDRRLLLSKKQIPQQSSLRMLKFGRTNT